MMVCYNIHRELIQDLRSCSQTEKDLTSRATRQATQYQHQIPLGSNSVLSVPTQARTPGSHGGACQARRTHGGTQWAQAALLRHVLKSTDASVEPTR